MDIENTRFDQSICTKVVISLMTIMTCIMYQILKEERCTSEYTTLLEVILRERCKSHSRAYTTCVDRIGIMECWWGPTLYCNNTAHENLGYDFVLLCFVDE